MAKKNDSLLIYTAYAEKFKKLTDAQFGQLMRCVIEYQATGEAPEIDDTAVALSFDVIKYDLDANNEKYEATVEKRREAGAKGGKQKQANAKEEKQELANLANASKCKQNVANQADNDNDNVNDNVIKKKDIPKGISKEKRFAPPTLEEVEAYCRERHNRVNAQHFINYYESNGWKVGRNPMKDWKACVRTWEQRETTHFSVPEKPKPTTDPLLDAVERKVIGGAL